MDESYTFQLEVRVPQRFAPAFSEALTGNDDDIVLAAEKAMKAIVGESYLTESVELWFVNDFEGARADLADMARREKAERVTYGPYADES